MEVLSIMPKTSVAKKQPKQIKKGAKYCQSSFETFSSIRWGFPAIQLYFLTIKNKQAEESIEGKILTEMGLTKYCCRRMMISNVHLISNI